jgi:hypothetical protein
MIRSLMEYGIALFGGNDNALNKKLECVQYQAALIVTGAINKTSYEKLLLELGWPLMKDRANFQKATT